MRKSITATTTAQTVQATDFVSWLLPQSITIYNSGTNPVFFTANSIATTTDCIKIWSDLTYSTILTQPLNWISFITTWWNSTVVIETL